MYLNILSRNVVKAALGAAFVCSSFVSAQIDQVIRTNSPEEFNNAMRVANAEGGGTITIDIPRGEENEFLFVNRPPAFQGNNNNTLTITAVRSVTFNGMGESNILQIRGRDNRLNVTGVTFRNGNSQGGNPRQGGGIGTRDTNTNNFINVRNCRFIDCITTRTAAGGGGGGIRCRIGNRLDVRGSDFIRCTATTGGGIAVTNSNTVVRQCRFIRCESTGALDGVNNGMRQLNANGAAVRIDSPSETATRTIVVSGCEFRANVRAESVTRGGVALNIFSSMAPPSGVAYARVNNNEFIRNVGNGPTARIFVTRAIGPQDVSFMNNTFTDNDTTMDTSNANVNLIQ